MQTEGSESVDRRLAEVVAELRDLQRAVVDLTTRIGVLERTGTRDEPELPAAASPREEPSAWSWLGRSRVLPRVAMVCFVLVAALVLRTLTDSRIIGLELGVLLGIGYAVSLIGWGAHLLAHGRRGQRVLPACGVLLLCTVVLEAHGPFGVITATTANWILLAALVVVTALGLHYRIGAIVAFAVLAPATSAIAIGFPNPPFPHAAATLLAANVAAYLALRIARQQWLSWATFGLTLVFWMLWSFKANAFLRHPEGVSAELWIDWFLPLVGVFAVTLAVLSTLRAAGAPRSFEGFHAFVPTANALWAFAAAVAVVLPQAQRTATLGTVFGVASLAHFGIAGWSWRRLRGCAEPVTAFTVAGTVMFALATASAFGSIAFALPLWALLALGLTRFSIACASAGLRATSYLLQLVVCAVAIASDSFAVPPPSLPWPAISALLIAAFSFVQYRLARREPPPADSWLAGVDRAKITLLWVAAICAFGFVRLLAYRGLELLGTEIDDTFQGAQSVIINGAAIALLLWSTRTRDKEILGTAILVGVYGGLRVFGSDLLTCHGIPLVLSVFSFGVAAAVGSLVLRKWQA